MVHFWKSVVAQIHNTIPRQKHFFVQTAKHKMLRIWMSKYFLIFFLGGGVSPFLRTPLKGSSSSLPYRGWRVVAPERISHRSLWASVTLVKKDLETGQLWRVCAMGLRAHERRAKRYVSYCQCRHLSEKALRQTSQLHSADDVAVSFTRLTGHGAWRSRWK